MTQRTPPVWSPYDLDAIPVPQAPRLSDVLRMQAQRAAGVLPQDRPEAQADGSGYYRQDSPYLGASPDALTFANRGNFGGGLVSWPFELARGEGRDGSFADRLMNTAEAFSPIQAAIGAGQSFDRQARHMSGDTQYDMTTPEGRQESFMDVFGLAGMLPAAGVAAGRTMPNNAAGIFGGRLAKTADQTALAKAEELAAKGAPREQIWNDTGWFRGVDGKWRFEIDDSKSAMASNFNVGDLAPLPEALKHPDLYGAYDMSRVTAERVPGPSSMIFEDNMQIGGNSPNDARLGGLHEAQHRVQKEEGFSRGGSPQSEGRIDSSKDPTVASRQRVFDSLKDAQADAFDAYTAALREPTPVLFGRKQHEAKLQQLKERVDRIAEQRAAAHSALMEAITVAPSYDYALGWSRYNRLAGEVEARTTQSRADLTPEQRRARPPWLDYDVPENQQIVRLASNPDDVSTAAILAGMTGQDQPGRMTVDGYHGTRYPEMFESGNFSELGGRPPQSMSGTGNRSEASRDLASIYATGGEGGAVYPVQAKFSNPYVFDAGGRMYDDLPGGHTIDSVANKAWAAGHDGLVARNVLDPPTPSHSVKPTDVFQALKRGTVYDANGNLIFSNPDDVSTAAILALLTQQQGQQQQ